MVNKFKVSVQEWSYILWLFGYYLGYLLFIGWFKRLFLSSSRHYVVYELARDERIPDELREETSKRIGWAVIVKVTVQSNIFTVGSTWLVESDTRKFSYSDWDCEFKVIR